MDALALAHIHVYKAIGINLSEMVELKIGVHPCTVQIGHFNHSFKELELF